MTIAQPQQSLNPPAQAMNLFHPVLASLNQYHHGLDQGGRPAECGGHSTTTQPATEQSCCAKPGRPGLHL
jgi:hypothetical protein